MNENYCIYTDTTYVFVSMCQVGIKCKDVYVMSPCLMYFLLFWWFQEIEQDRHLLRRKLLSTQSECDSRLLELQADIRELQNAVDERENALKQTEKEKTLLIAELTEQNQRLQIQIKEVDKIMFSLYYI